MGSLPHSAIVTLMSDLYSELFDGKAHVNACHAGLECGILGTNYPGVDMISFGPNIRGAHSPDEKCRSPVYRNSGNTCWLHWRGYRKSIMKMNKSKWTLLVLVMLFMLPQAKGQQAGLGMFRPAWFEQPVLYLYGPVEYNKTSQDHTPVDSIVFQVEDGGGVNIISAPPYLVPEHLKLDYDVLWFRVIGITGGFLEVIVNSTNGQTAYIRKDQEVFCTGRNF